MHEAAGAAPRSARTTPRSSSGRESWRGYSASERRRRLPKPRGTADTPAICVTWSEGRPPLASIGVSRSLVFGLYGMLVVIWSSTWVAIKIGLEDCPPLLGAGVRFAAAGLVLLAVAAVQRRPLRTDWVLAGGARSRRSRSPTASCTGVSSTCRRGSPRSCSGSAALHRAARRRAAARRAAAAPLLLGRADRRSRASRSRSSRASSSARPRRPRSARRARAGAARRRGRQHRSEAPRGRARRGGAERLGDAGRGPAPAAGVGAVRGLGRVRLERRSRSARSPTWRCSARRSRS